MATDSKIPLNMFQQWMQQMLLDPHQKTAQNPADLLPPSFEGSVVKESSRLSAKEHLAIYQRSYIARLRNCMAQHFSALEYCLGEELFTAFADEYLAENPSTHYNLGELGRGFTKYLENARPDREATEKEEWIDFIIALADFEFKLNEIFEEQAEEHYKLATSNTNEANLKLVPICYLFKYDFPVQNYYSDFKHERTPEVPLKQLSYCVVLRHNFKLSLFDIHEEQFHFLTLLKRLNDINLTIEQFAKDYSKSIDEVTAVWQVWKARWIELNFFREQ